MSATQAIPGAGAAAQTPGDEAWKPLRLFNLYRATLAALCVGLALSGLAPRAVAEVHPPQFLVTAVLYFALAVVMSFAIRARWPRFKLQIVAQVTVDILAITAMMHAGGGVRSGFGVLLVVAVAGGSILSGGRIAFLFGAMATLAVLGDEVYSRLIGLAGEPTYTQAGLLGATFFATAYLAHVLARRVRESEALAVQRGRDLASLAQLNEHIIQRMQSGILALTADDRVRLMNGAARRLLGYAGEPVGLPLRQISPELDALLTLWRADPTAGPRQLRPSGSGLGVIGSFAAMAQPQGSGTLVFLEDSAAVTQRAQVIKLASLGRLAASIAHEVRNPLGAISHAGQLLAESPGLAEGDRRLTRIIGEQCQRVNAIVQSVMEIGRRRAPAPTTLRLGPWLGQFLDELARDSGIEQADLVLEVEGDGPEVRMDPMQLHQVLHNLCENGRRHARGHPALRLRVGIQRETDRPYLDVCDSGPGVPEDSVQHLFEPFFTTDRGGTGLGLYIARELCEVNQASLNHLGAGEAGHCFRITFAHPLRRGYLRHE